MSDMVISRVLVVFIILMLFLWLISENLGESKVISNYEEFSISPNFYSLSTSNTIISEQNVSSFTNMLLIVLIETF